MPISNPILNGFTVNQYITIGTDLTLSNADPTDAPTSIKKFWFNYTNQNLFLAIAVGAGIPAMIGFVSIIIYTFKASLTASLIKETEGTILVVAIAVLLFLMSCWLDLVIYEPRISMLLWYLLGGMYGLTKQAKIAQNPFELRGQSKES